MSVPQFEGSKCSVPPPRMAYRAGLFRLAGFGGALVMLRLGVVNDPPRLTVDVGFLGPTDYRWVMRKTMGEGLPGELRRFFFACASEMRPELTVVGVLDAESGLCVRVLASSDDKVEVEFAVGDEGLNMETTRVALTLAAEQIAVLETPTTRRFYEEHDGDW